MATFGVELLSGTPASGRVIPVVAIVTPGTVIHTAVGGATSFDEVYLWAANISNAPVTLTLEWGGAGVANHLIDSYTIQANSPLTLIAPGLRLNGGLVIAAYASVTNVINVSGNVNTVR